MRSFPNVYVFSGGNVDTHKNETLLKALQREILEETRLTISIHEDAWTLQCVWESVYPTMELMDIMRKDHNKATGNDKMTEEQEPMICAHHVVCYFLGQLNTTIIINATNNSHRDSKEVDGAVWLSHDDIQRIVTLSNELFLRISCHLIACIQ